MAVLAFTAAVGAILNTPNGFPHIHTAPQLIRYRGASCVADPMPTDTTELYATLDRLLRRAERSSSVRALSKQWLTMPPEQLVESALIIGTTLVGSFSQGCELLGQAEEYAGLNLSPKAYAALMRLGQAEGRSQDVLGLLGRLRACGVEASPLILRTAMVAAADLGDWGAVSRLFNELAGSDSCLEALELIGSPAAIEDFRRSVSTGDTDLTKLTRQDADAIRLALRAYCSRGDSLLVGKALDRMRELGCPLNTQSYLSLMKLARSGSEGPLRALRVGDLRFSATTAFEPYIFELRNAMTSLARADRELISLIAIAAIVCVGLHLLGHSEPTVDPLDQFFP